MNVPTWSMIIFGASTYVKTFINHRAKCLQIPRISHLEAMTSKSRTKCRKRGAKNFINGIQMLTWNQNSIQGQWSRQIFTKQTLISGNKSLRSQIKSEYSTKSISKRESEVVASHQLKLLLINLIKVTTKKRGQNRDTAQTLSPMWTSSILATAST